MFRPVLGPRFDKLQRQKRALLRDVDGLSASQLRFKPQPASWSILDVLDHVVKVEKASVGAVRENLGKGTSVPFRDRIGAWIVISVMVSPIRVKVPVGASLVWPETTATDFAGVAASWSETRDEMATLLESLQPEQLRIGLFHHPVSGWMTAANALSFLSAHLQHHRYQVKRLLSASRNI